MKYIEPLIKVIEIEQEPYTAQDFINERVEYCNYDQRLLCEIEEFNKTQKRMAEMRRENSYECVYIGRHNPDNYTDFYYPYVATVTDYTI